MCYLATGAQCIIILTQWPVYIIMELHGHRKYVYYSAGSWCICGIGSIDSMDPQSWGVGGWTRKGQEVKTTDEAAKSIATGSYGVYGDLTRPLSHCYKEGSVLSYCPSVWALNTIILELASIACCNTRQSTFREKHSCVCACVLMRVLCVCVCVCAWAPKKAISSHTVLLLFLQSSYLLLETARLLKVSECMTAWMMPRRKIKVIILSLSLSHTHTHTVSCRQQAAFYSLQNAQATCSWMHSWHHCILKQRNNVLHYKVTVHYPL